MFSVLLLPALNSGDALLLHVRVKDRAGGRRTSLSPDKKTAKEGDIRILIPLQACHWAKALQELAWIPPFDGRRISALQWQEFPVA